MRKISHLRPIALLSVISCVGISFHAVAEKSWITAADYEQLHVVISEGASPSEQTAAKEFQRYWRMTTGHSPTISSAPLRDKIAVWIGGQDNPHAGSLALDKLGDDGLVIRVLPRRIRALDNRRELVIAGGRARGTLYGVYEFFDRYMGVRWLTPEETHVPKAPPSLPRIDYRFVPPMSYRDISYRAFVNNTEFAAIHRLNGSWSGTPEALGGHTGYVMGRDGLGHTLYRFVNPREYFEKHPEYFAEIDGQRANYAQLCLTNVDVLRITIEKARTLLKNRAPYERILSISPMDALTYDSWCTCATCRAVDAYEESQAGTLIRFVNAVAEALETEFPDVYFDTLAYLYTRKAPRHVRPRDNVIIRLSSIECDFGRPLADPNARLNRFLRRDLSDWNRITKNLYVWDYTQNWISHQGPHPNVHVFQPNAQYFASNGVSGLYEQASPVSPHSDFEFLKGYVLAKSLWDPGTDWRKHYNEFISLYYREAAPFIHEYLDLITSKVLDDRVELTMNNEFLWMNYEMVLQAEAIFQRAFETVKDASIGERLQYAYLPVQFSALVSPVRVELWGDRYILTRPPSLTLDEYRAMINEYGVTHIADGEIEIFWERLGGQTPPRYQEMPIERIENERYAVWVVPDLSWAIVRFEDKRYGVNLLNGPTGPPGRRGKIREHYVVAPPFSLYENPIGGAYEIIGRTEGFLALRTVRDNGLVIERRMHLAPGSDTFDIELALTNSGHETFEPHFKLHPEFSTPGKRHPTLWYEYNSEWKQAELVRNNADWPRPARLPHNDVRKWMLRVPGLGVTLVNAVDGSGAGELRYRYSAFEQRVSLDVSVSKVPLVPGASRTIRSRYWLSGKRPRALMRGL